MRDLDTCDELGTDVGSTLERDGEAWCYSMPYLLFTPHPFTRFPERLSLSPAHYAIKSSAIFLLGVLLTSPSRESTVGGTF